MPLARLQVSILNHLRELGRLNDEQVAEVSITSVELSGSDMDLLLIEDYKLMEFQLLVAKSHAVGLRPYNAGNFLTHARAIERIERDFCKEHDVLPVGEVGEYFIIAISDPFNLRITNRIQEMTGMNVVALLVYRSTIDYTLFKLLSICLARCSFCRMALPSAFQRYRFGSRFPSTI